MATPRQSRKGKKVYTRIRKGVPQTVVLSAQTGRPLKYKKNLHDDLARGFMLLGMNEKDLARNLGISITTLADWKLNYPSFRDSIYEGGEYADQRVASALYITASQRYDVKGHNVRAAEIWLRNRKRKLWNKGPEDEEPPPPLLAPIITNNQIDISKLPDDVIRIIINAISKGTAS